MVLCVSVVQFKQMSEKLAPITTQGENFATTSGLSNMMSNPPNLE